MSNYYRPSMFGGFSFFPPVIKMLMILNAAVFLTVEILGNFTIGGIRCMPSSTPIWA